MPSTEGPFKDLLPCYYGSIGPLYLTRFEETGNVHDLARYTPPHTDQQSVEPMGIRAQVVSGEMVFFDSIEKELYPKRFIDLRKAIVDNIDPEVFQHPVDGQIYGYFSRFDPSHSADERNGCRVNFTFERVATSNTIVTQEILRDAFSAATIAAAAADVGMEDLGIELPAALIGASADGAPLSTMSAQVEDWRGFLDAGGKDLSVSEITGKLNTFRQIIDTTLLAGPLEDARNYEVYRAIRTVSVSIVEAAEQASSNAITLIEFSLDAESSPLEIAQEYYRDISRADEIAALNACRYFFYPKHTRIRIPDR